jgi:hypothetical protein
MASLNHTCRQPRTFESSSRVWLAVAMAFFIVATTISFSSTTVASRAYIEPIRVLSLAAVLAIVCVVLLRSRRVSKVAILALGAYGAMVAYAVVLSVLYQGFRHIEHQFLFDVALGSIGIYLVSSLGIRILPREALIVFLAVVAGAFGATMAVGGFVVAYPPQFLFEYSGAEAGVQVYYSQGISKFFGLGAIAAIFLAFESKGRLTSAALCAASLLLLALSLLGGARGDSLVAALVVFVYSLMRSRSSWVWWGLVGMTTLLIIPRTYVFDDFLIFNRFLNLQADAGIREMLLRQAADLLADSPACLVHGCGFGFFQHYYDYDSGLYPHNIALEAVIVLGLPLVAVALSFGLLGFFRYAREAGQRGDAFVLFYVYFVFLFMKSGTLLSAWLVLAGTFYFIARGLESVALDAVPTSNERAL